MKNMPVHLENTTPSRPITEKPSTPSTAHLLCAKSTLDFTVCDNFTYYRPPGKATIPIPIPIYDSVTNDSVTVSLVNQYCVESILCGMEA